MGWKQKVGVGVLLGGLAIGSYTVYKGQQSQIDKQKESISNLEKKIDEINTLDQTQNETSANLQKFLEELSGKNKELSELVSGLLNNPLVNRDVRDLYLKMIIPTVQIESTARNNSKNTGSGTLICSVQGEDNQFYSYILTAEHIIKSQDPKKPIKVYEYSWGQGDFTIREAKLIVSNKRNDLALLEIATTTKRSIAKLISKENIDSLKVFDKVYNVGCPETPPVPTYGEIIRKREEDSGEDQWLISAPGFFGNSGGGVYLERTKELFGVAQEIKCDQLSHYLINESTKNKMRARDHDVLIPHLSVIASPTLIYSWLDNEGLQFIYDEHHTRQQWIDSRKK